MNCPNCNALIEDHSLFCASCGQSIPEPLPETPEYNEQYNQTYNEQNYEQYNRQYNQPNNGQYNQQYNGQYNQQYNGQYNQQYNGQYNPYGYQNPVDARLAELGSSALTLSIIGIVLLVIGLGIVTVILHSIAWSKIRQARAINGGNKHFYISSLNTATIICNIITWIVVASFAVIALMIIFAIIGAMAY